MNDNQTELPHELIADGNTLLENLDRVVIETWNTAPEVFAAWQACNNRVRVITNNQTIYRKGEKPQQVLLNLFGRENGNMFLDSKFRKEMYGGIVGTSFFQPKGEMLRRIMTAIHTYQSVEIDYSGLNLVDEEKNSSFCHVLVSDNNTPMERKLISAVYGTKNSADGRKIYLLKPFYVNKRLEANPEGVLARACIFYPNQDFNAAESVIDYGTLSDMRSAVRGERRRNVA